jgi:hypothetical protein
MIKSIVDGTMELKDGTVVMTFENGAVMTQQDGSPVRSVRIPGSGREQECVGGAANPPCRPHDRQFVAGRWIPVLSGYQTKRWDKLSYCSIIIKK